MCNCAKCPDAISALQELSKVVRFVDPRPKNPDRPKRDLEKTRIEKDGSISVPLSIMHPSLGRDVKLFSVGWMVGVASLSYLARSQSICINQTNSTRAETLEEMIRGLVEVAKEAVSSSGAAYGWIDAFSEVVRPRKVATFGGVRHWFFANIFGPELVSNGPAGFFENCPVYERFQLADGSLMLISSRTFEDWFCSPSESLVSYLAEHAPNVSIFRASNHEP